MAVRLAYKYYFAHIFEKKSQYSLKNQARFEATGFFGKT